MKLRNGYEKRRNQEKSQPEKIWYHGLVLEMIYCTGIFKTGKDQGKIEKQLVVPKSYRSTVLNLAHESILGGH